MDTRVKTFQATGIATAGRLYAGDLNAIQDAAAAHHDFGQTVDLATLRVGDTSLQILKYGTGIIGVTSQLRVAKVIQAAGGIIPVSLTTTQRDALPSGEAQTGVIIFNSTTARYEFNAGTDGARFWKPVGGSVVGAGWESLGSTVEYVSVDGPTFGLRIAEDATAVLSPGMKFKGTQTTDKFGIITSVGAYSGGFTPFTIYGGTDYTWINASIVNPGFATVKSPFGFPNDPAKWMVEVVDTASRSIAGGSWVHNSNHEIDIPIGAWNAAYFAAIFTVPASLGYGHTVTLSTTNNSETDSKWTNSAGGGVSFAPGSSDASMSGGGWGGSHHRSRFITVASKTRHYLNFSVTPASATGVVVLRAVSAYL